MQTTTNLVPPTHPLANSTLEEIKTLGQSLAKHCQNYKTSSVWRSLTQLFVTLTLFFACFAGMIYTQKISMWLSLALAVPTGALMVRLFIIQHDCGHGAFFKSKAANNLLGRFMSIFSVTPYDFWKRAHNIHHACCGNLDKRGVGDITTLTVKEYKALSWFGRIKYRLYRNPIFLFLIGVPIHFAILQRLPFGQPMPFKKIWASVLGLDITLALVIGGLMYWLGVVPFLTAYIPALIVAAVAGGWMFFVQHQYEEVYWENNDEWSFHLAGLLGSSYYKLPKIVQWFTGNIGLHHIHHLNSMIPNYRMQECMDASPELQALPKRLHFFESLKCIPLTLWDEDTRRLVSFRSAKRLGAAAPMAA